MRAPAPIAPQPLSIRGTAPNGRRYVLALGAFLALSLSMPALATDLFANATCGDDAYDGLSMEVGGGHGPKLTIQAAIDIAANGDTVTVAQGTYYECINFNGKAIAVQSTDPDDSAVVQNTTIDGGGDWGNPATVVTCSSGETNSSVLMGFTITSTEGLGVSCTNSSSPTISKNRIVSNVGMAGGGIHCGGSSPVITGNTVSYNSGMSRGGIYCTNGASPTISNNTITDNSAENGGGIYCWQSSPSISNNVIAKNSASNCGGGIYLSESSATITNSTIADNTILDDFGFQYGAGIYVSFGMPTVKDSIIWDNKRAGVSNEIHNDGSSLAVTYSDVKGGWSGTGNIDTLPDFADAAGSDYHLKSTEGRWLPGTGWMTDGSSSPCIDAGDPASACGNEPAPNGACVNMGAYGNTAEASKTGGTGPQIVVSTQSVTVPEGDTATFTVELSAQPAGDVTVSVAFESGDADITVQSGASLLFTTTDWDTPQTVTLAAAEDNADADNGSATIRASAPDMENIDVTATEQDNDKSLTVTDGTPAGTTVHQAAAVVDVSATPADHYHFSEWTGDTTDVTDVYAADTTITMNADASITADAAIDQHTVTTNAVHGTVSGGGTYDYGANAQLQATADTGYSFFNWTDDVPPGQETDNPLSLTVTGNLTLTANFELAAPELDVSTAALSVPEGDSNTFTVKLTAEPGAAVDVTTAVLGGGDADITVQSGALLTFTPMNWDSVQTVTLAAAADDTDADDGSATVRVSAPNMTDVDVAATESDDDFTLTVTAGPNGSVDPSGASVHTSGQVVDLTATPDQDCQFAAWTGDTANIADPDAAVTTITMDADASITATFTGAAPTYYVDATLGNDMMYDGLAPEWDGVHGPKQTIQAAVDLAGNGSTVVAAPGTYFEYVDFLGKPITVTSTDPSSPDVVSATVIQGDGSDYLVTFGSGETQEAVLRGFTLTNDYYAGCAGINCMGSSPTIESNVLTRFTSSSAITCSNASPVIRGNTITDNCAMYGAAMGMSNNSAPLLVNNVIWGNMSLNTTGGIYCTDSSPRIINCTIARNLSVFRYFDYEQSDNVDATGGNAIVFIDCPDIEITNCIIRDNWGSLDTQISMHTSSLDIDHTNIEGGHRGIKRTQSVLAWDQGNRNMDPRFADPVNGDFHLRSVYGRWNPDTATWVADLRDSPCIDAGNPADDYSRETTPNGSRVNMGAYGNTPYASRGVQFSDSDGDGLVGYFEVVALGTDPLSVDTDADGMPDGWEYAHGLNPLADDSGDDMDLDGLTNADEYSLGTDPSHYDSDGDGLGDAWEDSNGLDPSSGANDGLVAYWRCDDVSGAALWDDCTKAYADQLIHGSLCRHTGVAPNGCTWDWGGINGCLSLDGIDQYVTVSDGPSLDLTADLTLTLWLKAASFSSPDDPVYAFVKEDAASVTESALRYTKSTGALEFAHTNDAAQPETAAETCDLVAGTWYHIAVTISSSSVQFYLDGAPLGSAHQLSYSRSSAGDIFLGRSLYDTSSAPLHGYLDEIRLYSVALSAQDIADLTNERDADSDGDGLTNEIEFLFDTDIAVDDSVADDDGDGLTNADETMVHGTDHTNADSDGDGMNDGDEINGTTNALLADQGSDVGGPLVTLTYPAPNQTIGF